MAYKILVTTVATRLEAVSVKTDVIELDDYSEACRALERLGTDYYVGSVHVDRRATAINFFNGG